MERQCFFSRYYLSCDEKFDTRSDIWINSEDTKFGLGIKRNGNESRKVERTIMNRVKVSTVVFLVSLQTYMQQVYVLIKCRVALWEWCATNWRIFGCHYFKMLSKDFIELAFSFSYIILIAVVFATVLIWPWPWKGEWVNCHCGWIKRIAAFLPETPSAHWWMNQIRPIFWCEKFHNFFFAYSHTHDVDVSRDCVPWWTLIKLVSHFAKSFCVWPFHSISLNGMLSNNNNHNIAWMS